MALHPYSKSQAMPEPMNAATHHPKVKLSITPGEGVFIAGKYVTGKMEMECRADKGLGIGVVMIELFAIQELTSRDHSATSTFLHSRRLFQGPGLPPSNAVHAHPIPGEPPLAEHHFPARRGHSTFFFRIPLPTTCPSSITFAQGQAKVKYELRASAGIFWKNDRRVVVDKKGVDVVERFAVEDTVDVLNGGAVKVPQGVVVGEGGKLWMQGRVLGGVVVAGESTCLELQIKNHSTKKNTSLTLLLTRTLYLPASSSNNTHSPPPVQISDTLTTVPFRGPEYIIPPGAEGVANLVFDVPKDARGVRGGMLDGEEVEGGQLRISESLFEIRCKVEVRLGMGMGSKDIRIEIPIDIVHPKALSEEQPPPAMVSPTHHVDQVWIPPPAGYFPYYAAQQSPPPVHPMSPHPTGLGLHFPVPYMHPVSPPPPTVQPPMLMMNHLPPPVAVVPPRPLSAGPVESASQLPQSMVPEFPAPEVSPVGLLPFPLSPHPIDSVHPIEHQSPPGQFSPGTTGYEPEEGKGERAHRVSQHLRLSSRHRSVSPLSHRHPLPQLPARSPLTEDEEDIVNYGGTAIPPTRTRTLPLPPSGTSPAAPVIASSSPLTVPLHQDPSPQLQPTVLHSPRPQLTPKRSFSNAYPQSIKSERVEELEKMADVVVRRSGENLSGDVPKGVVEKVEEEVRQRDRERIEGGVVVVPQKDVQQPVATMTLRRNKTLPGPPPTNGVNLILPMQETDPVPSDQTPPTPTLHALAMRSRDRDKEKKKEFLQELRTETGLDALERRLLREVGTRKMNAPPRPDVRGVLLSSPLEPLRSSSGGIHSSLPNGMRLDPVGGGGGQSSSSKPIMIPTKSPEHLNNDSAISSLTLAGRMAEMAEMEAAANGRAVGEEGGEYDSDGGRTHRAGSRSRSRSLSMSISSKGKEEEDGWDGTRRHTRERAEVAQRNGRTPTKTPDREKDNEETSKTSSNAQHHPRKKDKSSIVAAKKGRVAAWLGEIDVGVPPQEQVIPPSPSVVRVVDDELATGLGVVFGDEEAKSQNIVNNEKEEEISGGTAAPNPRSSGFVPISTIAGNTLTKTFNVNITSRPLILRDATVVEEAKKVQALWGGDATGAGATTPTVKATTPTLAGGWPSTEHPNKYPKFPLLVPSLARAQTIRTDRKVSPPSNSLPDSKKKVGQTKGMTSTQPSTRRNVTPTPMTYSAAAKNATKVADYNAPAGGSGLARYGGGRLPSFPSPPAKSSLDPEVNYDFRSARGGRGGKVTTVANLWASGAIMNQGGSGNSTKPATNLAAVAAENVLQDVGRLKEKGKEVVRRILEQKQKTMGGVLLEEDEGQKTEVVKPIPPSKDTKPLGVIKPEKKLFSAALMTPSPPVKSTNKPAFSSTPASATVTKPLPPPTAPKPPSAVAFTPSGATKPLKEAQKRQDLRTVFKSPASTNLPNSSLPQPSPRHTGASNVAQKRPLTVLAVSNPTSVSQNLRNAPAIGGGRGGKSSIPIPVPMRRTSVSTPSSPGRNKDNKADGSSTGPAMTKTVAIAGGGGGGALPKPSKPGMIPPKLTNRNPASAVLSSSHAVPHLSSTASLAREYNFKSAAGDVGANPVSVGTTATSTGGTTAGGTSNTTTSPAPAPPLSGLTLTRSLPTMLLTSKSAPSLKSAAAAPRPPSASAAAVDAKDVSRPLQTTANKPADLSFGQARLRDLIKKYQNQGA